MLLLNKQQTQVLIVSVIIPIYNAERFLAHTVTSVMQLEEVGEIILVEDGSKDQSYSICNFLATIDARIKVIRHEGGLNRGAAESRNLGIKHANCDYIAFLDADDLYFPNRFQNAKTLFQNSMLCDGLFERVILINSITGDEKLFGISKPIKRNKLFAYFLEGGYSHTSGIIVKRQFLIETGFFNQKLWPHEDVDMWIRLTYKGSFCIIPDGLPVAKYIKHETNGIYNATSKTYLKLWVNVFRNYFFNDIILHDRYLIIKRVVKYFLLSFKKK